MKTTIPPAPFSAILLSIACVTPCFARAIPMWFFSYEKLVLESDTVAIVELVESKSAPDVFSGYGRGTNDYTATNALLKVHAVLKGSATNKLTLLHFSYSTNVTASEIGINNGADFIRFPTNSLQNRKPSLNNGNSVADITNIPQGPTWLAFLKRRDDGRFDPVTGHYDAAYSFRKLQ
jgi:hypothetical protein